MDEFANKARDLLIEAMVIGVDGAVDAHNLSGQTELVLGDKLPVIGSDDAVLAKWGFVLGETDPSDRMFRAAAIPRGWRRRRTDHPMWTEIVDDMGRVRVRIFYKSCFYDRDASMHTVARFRVDHAQPSPRRADRTALVFDATDCGRVVHREIAQVPDRENDKQSHYRAVEQQSPAMISSCAAWLDQHAPSWRDPVAAWALPALPEIADLTVPTSVLPSYRIMTFPGSGSAESVIAVAYEDGEVVHEVHGAVRPIRRHCRYDGGYDGDGYDQGGDGRAEAINRAFADARGACEHFLDNNAPGWRDGSATVSLSERNKREAK